MHARGKRKRTPRGRSRRSIGSFEEIEGLVRCSMGMIELVVVVVVVLWVV
jgi:hypothetical protein